MHHCALSSRVSCGSHYMTMKHDQTEGVGHSVVRPGGVVEYRHVTVCSGLQRMRIKFWNKNITNAMYERILCKIKNIRISSKWIDHWQITVWQWHTYHKQLFLSHDAMRRRVHNILVFLDLLLFILNTNVANARLQYCSINAKFVVVIDWFYSTRNCSLSYNNFMIKIKLKLIVNCYVIIPYNFNAFIGA